MISDILSYQRQRRTLKDIEEKNGTSFRKTPFEDRAANNLLYSKNNVKNTNTPYQGERQNDRRDTDLGRLESSTKVLPNRGLKRIASIGDSSISYNLSPKDLEIKKSIEAIDSKIADGFIPTAEQAKRIGNLRRKAGFLRGGTDRSITDSNGNALKDIGNENNNLAEQARRRFNARPAVNPTEEQLRQYDYQEGLKSGRTVRPIRTSTKGLSNRARRELAVQESKNRQSGIENAVNNATARDRNNIERDHNRIQEQTQKANQSQANQRRDNKVINQYDPISGNIIGQKIISQNADGSWPNQDTKYDVPTKATKAKMLANKNNKAIEDIYIKRFGALPY